MRRWLEFLVKNDSEENPEYPKIGYLFQWQSEITKHWFDLNIEWVEENFSTREHQFYKRLSQSTIEGQYGSKYPTLPVPIVNAEETGEIQYHSKYTLVEYHQNASNSYCFNSLAYVLTVAGEKSATRAIVMWI